jgi:hypothetical protein
LASSLMLVLASFTFANAMQKKAFPIIMLVGIFVGLFAYLMFNVLLR